jgi:hypothetical protein
MKIQHQLSRSEYIDCISRYPKDIHARYEMGEILGKGGYATGKIGWSLLAPQVSVAYVMYAARLDVGAWLVVPWTARIVKSPSPPAFRGKVRSFMVSVAIESFSFFCECVPS